MIQPANRRHATGQTIVHGFAVRTRKRVADRRLWGLGKTWHDHSRIQSAGKRNSSRSGGFEIARQNPVERILKFGFEILGRQYGFRLPGRRRKISVLAASSAGERP